jgi:hypothetical protein
VSLSGLVHAEGAPAAGAVVLLTVPRDPWVLGAAETDADGSWKIETPEPVPDDAEVLVTLRGPVLGTAWRPATDASGAMEVDGPFHTLAISAPGGDEAYVDPEQPADLPDRFRGYLRLRSATVEDAHLATLPLDDGETSVRVAPGRWIVGGGTPVPDGPLTAGPQPVGLAPLAAVQDGHELTGSPYAGYDVDVDGDTRVELRLGEVSGRP